MFLVPVTQIITYLGTDHVHRYTTYSKMVEEFQFLLFHSSFWIWVRASGGGGAEVKTVAASTKPNVKKTHRQRH